MLHSSLIGIMELISTCYSVQLVCRKLPLHPPTHLSSLTPLYGNRHCSSGFPHPLIHISFISNSYFCACVKEKIHILAALLQFVLLCMFGNNGWIMESIHLKERNVANWRLWFCCWYCVLVIGYSFMCVWYVYHCTAGWIPLCSMLLSVRRKKSTVFHS